MSGRYRAYLPVRSDRWYRTMASASEHGKSHNQWSITTKRQSHPTMSSSERINSSEKTTYFYNASAALHRPVSALTTLPNKVDASISLSGGNKNRQPNELKRTSYTLGRLPYLTPWYPKSYSNSDVPPDFSWLSESCGSKAAIGIFGGAVCGLLMGVFLGAMSDMTPPVTIINGKEVPTAPLKEQMRTTMRATGEKCIYWSIVL